MLSLKPKKLRVRTDDKHLQIEAWFYEEGKGFEIVVEIKGVGNTVYIHIPITWRTILSSVKRYKDQNPENLGKI